MGSSLRSPQNHAAIGIAMQSSTLDYGIQPSTVGKNLSYGYLIACLLLIMISISSMWFYPVTSEEEAVIVPGARLLYNSVMLAMASCLVLFYRHTIGFLLQYKLLTALIVVHFASILVSIEPLESLRFGIRLLLLVTFFGIAAMIIKPEKFMRIIVGFFLISGIANLLYIIGLPQYGIMSGIHEGAWRGLFSHKNQFGYFCAYGLVLCYNLLPRSFLLYGVMGLLYLLLLLKSQSGGALACAIAGMVISSALIYNPRIHWHPKAAIIFATIMLAIAIIPFYGMLSEWVLGMLGKDPTLTNRTEIWNLYLAEFGKSPILGLGGNAYLFNEAFMLRIEAGMMTKGNISPHNGYIATLIQVGIVGLVIYCLIAARILIAGIMGALRAAPQWHKLLTIFTVLHLIRGIGETGGSIKLTIFFALMVVAYVYFTQKPLSPEQRNRNA